MNNEIKQTIVGMIAGFATFGLALLLKMPWPLLLVLPIASYFGAYMISKPQLKIGTIKLKEANGAELQQLMKDALEDIEILKAGSKIGYDNELRDLSATLYHSGVAIFEHLQENPDKITLARRFIDYYLETASALLVKYDKLKKSKVKGESVKQAREEVINGLRVLTNAFDKQFEHLMQGEIMDITTDVKVLKQSYRMEDLR